MSASDTASTALATLRDQIESLFSCHGNQFDPVRFHYIAALAKRAGQHSDTVSELVANKALQTLTQYQADFDRAKNTAGEQLETIQQRFPNSAEIAKLQFAHSQFKALQRLSDQLLQQSAQSATPELTLADLNQLLAKQHGEHTTGNQGPALDLLLHQQENEIRQQLLAGQPSPQCQLEPAGKQTTTAEPRELQASHRFRQAQLKHTTHKVLNKAKIESPDSPGPLNPQMLALRALTRMQQLSPEYVNRFVSHIDTLLWLEQANTRHGSGKKGKAAGKNSSRRKPAAS